MQSLIAWFVHRPLLVNLAMLLVFVLGWLSLAVVTAALVWRLGAGPGWAIAAGSLVMIYLDSYAHEPGHPQGLIAIATVVACLALLSRSLARGWPR